MPLPIAIDYRPALLSRAGIGRATRELANALAQVDDVALHLFGHSLARARVALDVPGRARLHRLPIAGRALPTLRRFGVGAERLAGNARLFHWTDYVQPPVGRARTVLTVHDLAFVRDPRWHGADAATLRERTRGAIAAATALTAPTAATAADVRAFAPDAPPTRVIPWGADHVPTTELPRPFAGDYALCVGTIEPRKNHLGLLRAWRELRSSRPHLIVVGAVGWECDEIVAALQQAEREGLLTWLRHADDATLWALLQHARALLYPALWEGFGFPPLEAMALGVPVVAHDAAPLREVCGDAVQFADATDHAALAAAIDAVLFDQDLRERHRRAGRARAAGFTWRACAEAHAQLYREVLA
jgi:glycosyltransferase involved in cell wall biosynthesis